MKITLTSLSTLVILCLSLITFAVPALSAADGRVDLAPLASNMEAKPKVNVHFGSAMMLGFAEAMRQSNPDVAGILEGVTGMRVMVFEDADTREVEPQVLDIIEHLTNSGWTPAVTVEDDETRINLLLLESGALVNGLVLLLRDGTSTAVFANIHGNLDPVIIGQLIGSGQGMNDLDLGGLMEQFQN